MCRAKDAQTTLQLNPTDLFFSLLFDLFSLSLYHMMKPRNNLRTPSDTVLLPCAVSEKAILI